MGTCRYLRQAACAAALLHGTAQGWTLIISPGPRALFLQVGNGAAQANQGPVNQVSGGPSAAQMGQATPIALMSNSTQSSSPLDGVPVCGPPSQVYLGAAYRHPAAAAASAQLQVISPPSLTSGQGQLPISTLSWSSTGGRDPGADLPSGRFAAGTQTLRSLRANRWVEGCLSFSYANTHVVPAGLYVGRVTYQLSAP